MTIGAYAGYEMLRVRRFTTIHEGMSKAAVVASLGEPTVRGPNGCLPETTCHGECWAYRQHLFEHLVLTFDTNGRVACREIFRPEIRRHG